GNGRTRVITTRREPATSGAGDETGGSPGLAPTRTGGRYSVAGPPREPADRQDSFEPDGQPSGRQRSRAAGVLSEHRRRSTHEKRIRGSALWPTEGNWGGLMALSFLSRLRTVVVTAACLAMSCSNSQTTAPKAPQTFTVEVPKRRADVASVAIFLPLDARVEPTWVTLRDELSPELDVIPIPI